MKTTTNRKQAILILLCLSLLVAVLPAGTCSAVSAVQPEAALYAAKTSDIGIDNFQNWQKKRVVFSVVSPIKKGMDGNEIEVSETKSGKVVYDSENAVLFDGAKTGVVYQYRIRYSKRAEGDPSQRVYGAWSGYRYFAIPKLSGIRSRNKVQVKWKKMWATAGYDIYKLKGRMQLKRTLGNMEASSWPAGKYAGKLQKIKSLGKNKTQFTMKNVSPTITYVIVVPKLRINGKNVKNDLESYVYH